MTENLFPVKKDGRAGFINNKGQVIIDLTFDAVGNFSEGFATYSSGDKVGFIDLKGNVIIPAKFDTAFDFSDGLAGIFLADKYGYIDQTGNFAIKPSYQRGFDFENGHAFVFEDAGSKGCLIDKTGKIILMDRNFLVSKYSEGLINCPMDGKWGFIDLSGKFIIPPSYEYTTQFAEGKAAVSIKKFFGMKERYGFINKNNEMIIPPNFEGADMKFSEDLCRVWKKGFGYIDSTGQLIIPCEFYFAEHFSEGLSVFKPKGKNQGYGFIDKTGKIVIEPIFTHADSFKNGLARVTVGSKFEDYKYGLIDKKGNFVWEPT